MKALWGLIGLVFRFFKLPLQIVVGAYISFALIAMTIAWHEAQKTKQTVTLEAENETCRNIIQS